jgi:hypothetical protein
VLLAWLLVEKLLLDEPDFALLLQGHAPSFRYKIKKQA